MYKEQPLILTLRLDKNSQAFFNAQRKLYFPAEKNFLDAHLTLFHQLPDEPATHHYFADLRYKHFEIQVTGLINLGAGVAYKMDSLHLQSLFQLLSSHFKERLIPQDQQAFRPHITVMNKTTPVAARQLLVALSGNFEAFDVGATGLDLWIYQGGPWQHLSAVDFL